MLDRTVAPQAQSITNIQIPVPQYTNLGNGVPALLIPDTNFPVISLELIVSSGKWHEIVSGTSHYAAKMIAEGTKKLTAEEISQHFESTGSFLEIVPSTDWVILKLHALEKFFDGALRLLFDLITEASFPVERFEKLTLLRKHNIQNLLSKNNQYANLKIGQQLFGEQHPYGRQLTPELATEVPLGDVKSYYQTNLFHEPKLTIVGDFESHLPLIDELAKQIPSSQKKETHYEIQQGNNKYFEERGTSTQASIRIGGLCMNKMHEDVHGFKMVHMLLGGYFGSRLMKNLREDKGLTYGISSQMIHLGQASYWIIGSEVNKENAEQAVEEIEKEITLLKEVKSDDAELKIAKNFARGKLLSSFDSSFSVASIHRPQFIRGLSDTYLSSYLKVLNEITLEEIQSLARKYLKPTHEVIIA